MPFIIAVDFDSTLCSGHFPEKGEFDQRIVNKIKEFQKTGNCEVLLWTCREGGGLQEAIDRCKEQGIEFDAVNDNAPSQHKWMADALKQNGYIFAHRKIFANIYVDDRSPGSIEFFLNIDVEATCRNFENV